MNKKKKITILVCTLFMVFSLGADVYKRQLLNSVAIIAIIGLPSFRTKALQI